MITKLKDSIYWAKALQYFERSEFTQARASLLKIRGAIGNSAEFYALMGTVQLTLRNVDEASIDFEKAKTASPTKASYRQYIDLYLDYYLSIMEGRHADRVKTLEGAIKLEAPRAIKRWLPLS